MKLKLCRVKKVFEYKEAQMGISFYSTKQGKAIKKAAEAGRVEGREEVEALRMLVAELEQRGASAQESCQGEGGMATFLEALKKDPLVLVEAMRSLKDPEVYADVLQRLFDAEFPAEAALPEQASSPKDLETKSHDQDKRGASVDCHRDSPTFCKDADIDIDQATAISQKQLAEFKEEEKDAAEEASREKTATAISQKQLAEFKEEEKDAAEEASREKTVRKADKVVHIHHFYHGGRTSGDPLDKSGVESSHKRKRHSGEGVRGQPFNGTSTRSQRRKKKREQR